MGKIPRFSQGSNDEPEERAVVVDEWNGPDRGTHNWIGAILFVSSAIIVVVGMLEFLQAIS